MGQFLGGTEIVLPRRQRIVPFVFAASMNLVCMMIFVGGMVTLEYNTLSMVTREGIADRFRLDEAIFFGMVALVVLVGLSLLLWIVLRVRYHRSLAGSIYRISQAGIQFPAPVIWRSYEVPFPALIPWSEIKTLVPYEVHLSTMSQKTIPMFGIVLRDYEGFLAHLIQEQRPGLLRRLALRIRAREIARLMAPINIPQGLLPISIDELIREITTRFAAEIQENHITVLGWQR
jgi:hypothetical protein